MTIRATARACSRNDPEGVDLLKLGAPATIVKGDDGEELAVRNGPTLVRLSLVGGTLLEGPVRLDYQLADGVRLGRQLAALRQWEALVRLGRVPRSLSAPASDTARRLLLLKTLDALAAARSPRPVAIALFGAGLVEKDWDHESDYLRMRTRRLIDHALRLADGGYLDLFG